MAGFRRYLGRNPALAVGLTLLLLLVALCVIGPLFVNTSNAAPLSVPANQPPSGEFPLGTDRQGRELLAVLIAGTPLTLQIGLIAGFLGTFVGTVLAFASAYYRGTVDNIIKGIVDVGLTIPGLLVLIIVAVSLPGGMTVTGMALVVASLSWLWPARTIRAQVLTLRERAWVQIARFSGLSGPEIIFQELIPNLLPYLAAALVGSVASAILASIGLEALGLGSMDAPTLGMTIYWVIFYSALLHGFWWWWLPPIVVIVVLFVGLFSLSLGLDEIANPRLRRSV
jgi:peptide/nickel transport system permease protein